MTTAGASSVLGGAVAGSDFAFISPLAMASAFSMNSSGGMTSSEP